VQTIPTVKTAIHLFRPVTVKTPQRSSTRESDCGLLQYNTRFQDDLGNPVPECHTILDFAAARDEEDGGGDKGNSFTGRNWPTGRPDPDYV